LTAAGNPDSITTMFLTTRFFETLGVAPVLGREFNADDVRPGGPKNIVISDALWRRAFGSDPNVLGRALEFGGESYTVIGVLPAGFWLPQSADACLPLRYSGTVGDDGQNTSLLARLKPRASSTNASSTNASSTRSDVRQAAAELATLGEDYRATNQDGTTRDYSGLAPIPFQQWLVGDVRTNLLVLFGAVFLLLVIACANLGSLLLARLAARRKEIGVRLALGSSSGRLLRLFLMENAVLVAAGSAVGLISAYWSVDALVRLFPYSLPASAPIRVDGPVLALTLALAVATGVVFSIAPLLTSARIKVDEALKSARSRAGLTSERSRSVLVIMEVALATTLLVAAALLIGSLYRLHQEHLGFTPQGVITFRTPSAKGKSVQDLQRFQAQLIDKIRRIPGVRNAASINVLPLTDKSNYPAQLFGHPDQSIGGMEIRIVTPSYFETMQIPVLRGRSLAETDTAAAPPVIAINETLARTWWPNASPFGDRIVLGRFRDKVYSDGEPPREVVGVVGDTKTLYLKQPARPTVYIPVPQTPWMGATDWVVRADLSPGIAGELRKTIAEIDPRQAVRRLRTMDEIVESAAADSRFDAWLFGTFAGLALVLTSIGVYGLLAFFVARRTSEIGIRLAMGASRGDILAQILKQGAVLIMIGLALGLAGAFAATRAFSKLLFGVSPTDPSTFAAVAALLFAIGMLASFLPARRASMVDPMVALRSE
jgi:putative ABC transport system permease protein